MPFEAQAIRGVKNFYNRRQINEGLAGGIETMGSLKELTVELSGYALSENITFIEAYLPEGAKLEEYVIRTDEAFVLGGTSPTILIGTDTSEGTNGVAISESQAETVGTYTGNTFSGTWANGLTANTKVGVALGGTNPTVTDAGKIRITIRYTKL